MISLRLLDVTQILSAFPAGNAIQAFGNGTDVSVWQSSSVQSTTAVITSSHRGRGREKLPNSLQPDSHGNHLNPGDNSLYQFCGNLQVSPGPHQRLS